MAEELRSAVSHLAEQIVHEDDERKPPQNIWATALIKGANGRNILVLGENHGYAMDEGWRSTATEQVIGLFRDILELARKHAKCVDVFIEQDYVKHSTQVWGATDLTRNRNIPLINLFGYLRTEKLGKFRDILRLHQVDLRDHALQDMSVSKKPFPKAHIPVLGFMALDAEWGERIHGLFPDTDSSEAHKMLARLMFQIWTSVYPTSRVTLRDVQAAVANVPVLISGASLMFNLQKNFFKLISRGMARTEVVPMFKTLFANYVRHAENHETPIGFDQTAITESSVGMFVMDYYTVFRMLVKDFAGKPESAPRVCRDDPPSFIIFYGGFNHSKTIAWLVKYWSGQDIEESYIGPGTIQNFLNL
jgi:hypothetical protein